MPSPFNLILPVALLTSPLLLAAAQPPKSNPKSSVVSLACAQSESILNSTATDLMMPREAPAEAVSNLGSTDTRSEPGTAAHSAPAVYQQSSLIESYQANEIPPNGASHSDFTQNFQSHIVQPISVSSQALVTSEQEWLAIASGLPTDSVEECFSKEEPAQVPASGPAPTVDPSNSFPSDIPNLEGPPTPPVPVTPGEPTTPISPVAPSEPVAPASTAPASSPTNSPTGASAIPARPVPTPAADPALDPSNYTPAIEAPTPFEGNAAPTLESLPDGSYRYLAGSFEYGNYTDEQLVVNGGSVFLLTKRGNEVTGSLYPRLGSSSICVTGTVSGDTVVGAAYPESAFLDSTVEVIADDVENTEEESGTAIEYAEVGDSFRPYGSTTLQVRQSRTVAGQTYYVGALLDLSNFSRINAGSSLAPISCKAPTSVPAIDAQLSE